MNLKKNTHKIIFETKKNMNMKKCLENMTETYKIESKTFDTFYKINVQSIVMSYFLLVFFFFPISYKNCIFITEIQSMNEQSKDKQKAN